MMGKILTVDTTIYVWLGGSNVQELKYAAGDVFTLPENVLYRPCLVIQKDKSTSVLGMFGEYNGNKEEEGYSLIKMRSNQAPNVFKAWAFMNDVPWGG